MAEVANVEVRWQAAKDAESDYLRASSNPSAKEWTAALLQKSWEFVQDMAP